MSMYHSDCVLERRVLTDRDKGLAATKLPLFILNCKDRKAVGYAEDKFEIYNQRVMGMKIGVRLADKPPAVSYLAILGAQLLADIVAVDKTVIVIRLDFQAGPLSYLIYDAVALSLRMIPAPEDPSWAYTISSSVSVARPSRGTDYALVHTGRLVAGGEDSLFLWRPSSSSPPWSDFEKAGALRINGWSETNTEFSLEGHAYWVDLLRGVFCFSCDALFDDNSSLLKFIPLPVEWVFRDHHRISPPAASRTMGVVCDSFIRFVSIDGFEDDDYVQLKDRTVTVWKLLSHDEGWYKEYEFSLKTLWRFKGFDHLPKDLTPMYPLLSMNDRDVVYLGLGEYRETKIFRGSVPLKCECFPYYPLFMLAVDMREKVVRTIKSMEDPNVWLPGLVSCSFSCHVDKALVGPCDGEGLPIRTKRKRLEKPICC